MIKLSVFLLSLFFPAFVLAQEAIVETEEQEVRRYTVEVIVFRYTENLGTGSEVFLPDEIEEPEWQEELDLLDEPADDAEPVVEPLAMDERLAADEDQSANAEAEPESLLPDIELVLLEEDRYELVEAFERLERLDAYEPLMHFGWTQATWPAEQTEAIPLHLFARPPEELDGSLTLYLGRYLHLVVNLQLRAPGAESDEGPASGFDTFAAPPEDLGELLAPPVFYRIDEDRILRNGETRYYDHPKFGLLARVSRVEDEAQADEGELLGYPVQ